MAHIIEHELETNFYFRTEIVGGKNALKCYRNDVLQNQKIRLRELHAGDPYPTEVLPKKIKILGKRKPTNSFFGGGRSQVLF